MKNAIKIIFSAALLLNVTFSVIAVDTKAKQSCSASCQTKTQAATLSWTTDIQELKKAESAFMDSFFELYSTIEITRFGNIKPETNDKQGCDAAIKKFLNTAFSNQVKALEKNAVQCVIAKVDGEVVGFASFEPTGTEGEIYVDQLAVSASASRKRNW